MEIEEDKKNRGEAISKQDLEPWLCVTMLHVFARLF